MIIFRLASTLISIYSLLCLFRIMLTWIPELAYSKFSYFLAQICDPYLNLFRGIRWLKIGGFDFSPALALCVLGAINSLLSVFINVGVISFAMLFRYLIEVIYTFISSILTFITILFAVRLLLLFIRRDSYNTSGYMTNQIDNAISPIVHKIARTFTMGKRLTYKSALIVAIIALIVFQIVFGIIFSLLINCF